MTPSIPNHGTARDPLATWCGWLLVGLAGLAPLAAWLGPLAFAVLVGGVGLLALPAARLTDEDRPMLVVLFAALIWAAVSTTWSPFHPKHPQDSTIVKLTAELPLYWSAICAARRANARLARWALGVFAWGFAGLGVVLVVEAVTGGALYQAIHNAVYEPIRPDLAGKNLGQATFVLALLWPLAALGGPKILRWSLALAMAVGVAAAAWRFGADAPLVALALGPLTALVVWRWPRGGPRVFAGLAAAFFLLAPSLMWAARRFADLADLQAAIPTSWSQRVGYWSHAIDWIGDKPLKGWGLDASRMFGPGIQLHPHDGALQIWLELGAIGAVTAAVFWGLALTRLSRPGRDLTAAATAASAATYLLFGGANFGIWQEWWLGLGALVVLLAALHSRVATAVELSTWTPNSA